MKSTKKQIWEEIEEQILLRKEDSKDIAVAKVFFNSGWSVHPESRYRFQKYRDYEDCPDEITGITAEEGRRLLDEMNR